MIKNILLISPVNPFESTKTPRVTHWSELYLRKFCESLTVFNYRKSTFPTKLHLAKCYVPGFNSWDIKRMNEKLLHLVDRENFDLILVFKGEDLFPETMRQIKESNGAIIASWMGDDPFSYRNIKNSLISYDFYFIWDSGYLEALRDSGVKNAIYMPVYAMPEVFNKMELNVEDKKRYEADVVFVGTWNTRRERVLKQLVEYDLKIYGNGWHEKSEISKRYLRPEVDFLEINKIYNSCKIILNIHHPQSKCGPNFRTFEAMGAGAFLLDERKRDITSMFVEGEELDLYEDVNELRSKIDYYLDREKERIRIADRGFQKVSRFHTLDCRYKTLFGVIEKSRESID
jgi:spore maturation protein CgeB